MGLSKTDQVFKGRWQAIGRTGSFTCPVALLLRVLKETGWTSGYLFRRIIRKGATRTNETGPRRFQPGWGGPEERCRKPAYNVYRDLFLRTLVRVGRGQDHDGAGEELLGVAQRANRRGKLRRALRRAGLDSPPHGRLVGEVAVGVRPLRAAIGGDELGLEEDGLVRHRCGGGRLARPCSRELE